MLQFCLSMTSPLVFIVIIITIKSFNEPDFVNFSSANSLQFIHKEMEWRHTMLCTFKLTKTKENGRRRLKV